MPDDAQPVRRIMASRTHWKGAGGPSRDPWALVWKCDASLPLDGLRVVATNTVRMPSGCKLVAYRAQRFGGTLVYYLLDRPDDPLGGEPADLIAERFVRLESRIVFLADVSGWAWVREFVTPQTRPIRSPSGRVAKHDIVAYAEIDSPPDEMGRWPRRCWALCHCQTRCEGVGCCTSLRYGGVPVNPLTIVAGQPSQPPNPTFTVRGSARCAAHVRRDEWLKSRGLYS